MPEIVGIDGPIQLQRLEGERWVALLFRSCFLGSAGGRFEDDFADGDGRDGTLGWPFFGARQWGLGGKGGAFPAGAQTRCWEGDSDEGLGLAVEICEDLRNEDGWR